MRANRPPWARTPPKRPKATGHDGFWSTKEAEDWHRDGAKAHLLGTYDNGQRYTGATLCGLSSKGFDHERSGHDTCARCDAIADKLGSGGDK